MGSFQTRGEENSRPEDSMVHSVGLLKSEEGLVNVLVGWLMAALIRRLLPISCRDRA